MAANASGVPYVAQYFGPQTLNGAATGWPTQLVFWIFNPGTFVYLSGGSLDVGVVRDSVLNNQNDLEIFQEVFEGIAFRGLASLQVVANIRPNGLSAGTINTSTY